MRAVRNGGAIATITADPPPSERAIRVYSVVVVPDGPRLAGLGELASAGLIEILVGEVYSLSSAKDALARVVAGTGGRAVVLAL